jgi:signal transduction histidine kinase
VFGLALLGLVVGLWMDSRSVGGDPFFSIIVFTFPTVGFIVANRRPRTTLAWLMLAMGIAFALPFESYAHYALTNGLPGGAHAMALGGPSWVAFIGTSGYLLLLFPDGHLPSPRWRWFSWMCGVGLILLSLTIVFSPGPFEATPYADVVNPLGLPILGSLGEGVFVLVVFAPLLVAGGAIAVIRRLRRATDHVERQQLRWLAWAAGWIASLYVLAFIPQLVFGGAETWENLLGSIAAISFTLIPITIGVAILKYRLYEIDAVIRRTVVVVVLSASFVLAYAGAVALIGAIVGGRLDEVVSPSTASAMAAAAVAVAIAFRPVLRYARRLADRVVYGKRANPYEVLSAFGGQLASTYAADDVLLRMARVLGEGIGAERARVWLQVGDDLRPVASWPDGAADGADDRSVDVRHQDETLGALSVRMPPDEPLDPAKDKLIDDLAAQAGLVLRNVRLTEELKARLADLQAAQKRLVTAQDEERRKLERNIHDGAQQQLVALQVRQRLAEQLVERDPAKVKEMLAQLQIDTGAALDDLRDLARGIYPPLLADRGLAPALEAQARKSPVPVRVEADGIERLPQEIEAAVYFSVLEALQNTAKYAEASSARVVLAREPDALRFEVSDDGRGFDADVNGHGSGLQGIADRLGALEGAVEVESAVGAGTTIRGRIPMGSGVPDREVRT